jgi:hypothetical protein
LQDKSATVIKTHWDVELLTDNRYLEPTRQALFYLRQQQMSIPDQYPDLIANSKQLNQARENALEFTNPQIPHILALLNPQQHSGIFPLSAGFVSVS